ncbi:MAG: hypothetical protein WCT07_00595 [Candidatus Paceibacterota bacterium]|jgi:hypothetical protein
MFAHLEIAMLQRLLVAERVSKPITHTELGRETQGSTFEDLWSRGYIAIKGQSSLITFVGPNSEYLVTQSGKAHLARHEAQQKTA